MEKQNTSSIEVTEHHRRDRRVVAASVAAVLLVGALTSGWLVYKNNNPPAPGGPKALESSSPSVDPSTSAVALPSITASSSSEAPSTSSSAPKPSPTAINTNLGTPVSYTLNIKAAGTEHVTLEKMSCPPDCNESTATVNGKTVKYVQLFPPDTTFGYEHVFDYDKDPRQIMAHSTEIPANASWFAGQNFDKITDGDTMELTTTTGTFEYVANSEASLSKDTNGGQYAYNDAVQALGPADILLTTCGVPNNNYNKVARFVLANPIAGASLAPAA